MIYWFWHGYTVDSGSWDVLNRVKNCTALQEHKQIGYLRKQKKYAVLIIQKNCPKLHHVIVGHLYYSEWRLLSELKGTLMRVELNSQFLCGLKGATNSFLFPLNRSPAKPR